MKNASAQNSVFYKQQESWPKIGAFTKKVQPYVGTGFSTVLRIAKRSFFVLYALNEKKSRMCTYIARVFFSVRMARKFHIFIPLFFAGMPRGMSPTEFLVIYAFIFRWFEC